MEKELQHVSPDYNQRLKDLALLLCTQVAEYHPSPYIIEDTRVGYDSEGMYHCPSLRTERQP